MGILNKRGAMDTFQFLILGVLVAGLFGMGAFDRFTGTQAATGAPAGSGGNIKIEGLPACIGVDKTTVTLSASDVYDSSVSIGGNHQYKINGGTAKTVTNSGTFDASPDDKLLVLWGQGNNSGTSVYLNKFVEYTLPCAGTKTFSEGLYRNGSITSRIFNEEGNLIDDVVENETLGAGDLVTLRHELEGSFERGQFANGGCAIVEYNNSNYDDVRVKYDKLGVEKKISTPSYFTVSALGFSAKTYEVPPFVSNEKLTGSITVDVDNTNNPTSTGDAGGAGVIGGADIAVHYRPNEVRLNPDNNQFELFACGEDQDGNVVANPIDGQLDILHMD